MSSEQGNKGFAKRHGIEQRVLEYHIREGNWEELRNQYRDKMYRIFTKDRLDIVEWRQSLLNQAEIFELMGVETILQDIAKQVMTKGHIFRLNDQEEVVRDVNGNPVIRTISKSMKEALKLTQELRDSNTEELIRINTPDEPKLLPAGTIEVEAIEAGNVVDLNKVAEEDNE